MGDTLTEGFYSLSKPTNKVGDSSSDTHPLLPELDFSMDDEELIALKRDWLTAWEPYAKEVQKLQDENENYWLGFQYNTGKDKGPRDNLIFESLETFLPIATRPKADPLVEADNSPEGNAIADKVRKMIIFVADNMSFNLKMKQVARYWALYMLGVMKVGWSMKENDITCVSVRPQKLILEPKATIQEGEYTGYYIGEKLEDMASDLIARFPKKKQFISDKVKDKLGTRVEYIMWTTDDYVFWTLEDEVLSKTKNPHWNYETQQPLPADPYTGLSPTNPDGTPQTQSIPGKNHFRSRKKPYVFLSIFNLGKQPHDDTNLVQQNIPLQDLINKRLAQIDKNADNANGGLIVSGDAFTEEQAGKASKALRNGGVIWLPSGDPRTAVLRDSGAQLPQFIYQSLLDYRNELRNIFGTRGSTPQGTIDEQTVRGKLITKGQDTDRIGGGISTYLEQFSDSVFNWFVQLMYVYYDEPHYATVLGKERAQEYISLVNSEFGDLKLTVSVKDGSMIPHDPVNQRNEAVQLWAQQGIDPITFFERLDFPNPRESAKQLFLWKANPVALFPDLMAQQQAEQQQQMAAQQQQQQQAFQQHGQQQTQQVQQKAQVDAQRSAQEHQQKMQQIQLGALSRQ